MKHTPKIILLSAAALSPFAYSAGFQISETSASGMGRANAGEAARVDNAGAMAKNPAVMSYFDKQAVSVVGHYIMPDINVEGTNNPGNQNADANDIAPSAFVPGAFYVMPINDQWAFGVALNSRFGLSTDYGDDYAASEHATEASIKSIYLTPSVSYKLNDSITFGLGISYITGEGELKNNSSAATQANISGGLQLQGIPAIAANAMAPPAGSALLDLEADGDAFGWNIGMMWQVNADARIGFSYMSKVDLDTDADYTRYSAAGSAATISGGPTAWRPVYEQKSGTLTFNLPDVAEVAYTQKIGEKWDLSASIQYTGWSAFESIKVDDDVLKEENWDNAMRYSIGADYAVSEDIIFRFGYAFDESPVEDENRTLSIPDADRNWFSIGGTFALPAGSIDAGLTYVKGKKVDVTETSDAGTTFSGELSKTNAMIVSLGYNISF